MNIIHPNELENNWIIFDGYVYDLSKFKHPYDVKWRSYLQQDITKMMKNYHPKINRDKLKPYLIGRLSFYQQLFGMF